METQQTTVGEKILEVMKLRGPVLPVHVTKAAECDILIASAHLSELASKKLIKISSLKVGGSPLYFLPGQESRLQDFTDNLHEKEKKAFDLLKHKKVLRDQDLDPVFKVAIREIKDFAIPLEVTHKGNMEIFWKWALSSNAEVEPLIKNALKIGIPETENDKKISDVGEIKRQEIKKEYVKKPKQIVEDLFWAKINNYFNRNKIEIIEKEIIKKNSEIELVIKIPSNVGDLTYFCKARSKKRIADSDMINAFVKGQLRKLPVLFLTDGELTKKGKEAMEKDFKLHFKQI